MTLLTIAAEGKAHVLKHSKVTCANCGKQFIAKKARQRICTFACARKWCNDRFNRWLPSNPRKES